MANPTFRAYGGIYPTDLTTDSAQEVMGPLQNRSYTGTLPGVDGLYVQENPVGGQRICVRGVYKTTGTTRLDAVANLRDLIDGIAAPNVGQLGEYVGTAERMSENALLESYGLVGPVQVYGQADPFTAIAAVQAQLLHLTPTMA